VSHINPIFGPRGIHSGVPSFFRANCYEASKGGAGGYVNAGWHLASAVGTQSPYDVELDEWQHEVDALKLLLDHDDNEAIWKWYACHYPRCMQLVPSRRREQFVAGVRQAYEEGRIEV
jgi:hypothetical protein